MRQGTVSEEGKSCDAEGVDIIFEGFGPCKNYEIPLDPYMRGGLIHSMFTNSALLILVYVHRCDDN